MTTFCVGYKTSPTSMRENKHQQHGYFCCMDTFAAWILLLHGHFCCMDTFAAWILLQHGLVCFAPSKKCLHSYAALDVICRDTSLGELWLWTKTAQSCCVWMLTFICDGSHSLHTARISHISLITHMSHMSYMTQFSIQHHLFKLINIFYSFDVMCTHLSPCAT